MAWKWFDPAGPANMTAIQHTFCSVHSPSFMYSMILIAHAWMLPDNRWKQSVQRYSSCESFIILKSVCVWWCCLRLLVSFYSNLVLKFNPQSVCCYYQAYFYHRTLCLYVSLSFPFLLCHMYLILSMADRYIVQWWYVARGVNQFRPRTSTFVSELAPQMAALFYKSLITMRRGSGIINIRVGGGETLFLWRLGWFGDSDLKFRLASENTLIHLISVAKTLRPVWFAHARLTVKLKRFSSFFWIWQLSKKDLSTPSE